MRTCLVILAIVIAVVPAWAADTSPIVALADPDPTFRVPEGDSPPVAGSECGPSSLPADSPRPQDPGKTPGTRLLDSARFAVNEASPMLVAQAAGTPETAPAATFGSSPWIFGATLYAWIPFATSDSTIDGLPPGRTS